MCRDIGGSYSTAKSKKDASGFRLVVSGEELSVWTIVEAEMSKVKGRRGGNVGNFGKKVPA